MTFRNIISSQYAFVRLNPLVFQTRILFRPFSPTPSPRLRQLLQVEEGMKQINLFKKQKSQRFFGGQLLLGRRKKQRPLSNNQALHIVLKSQWARGKNAFTHKDNFAATKALIHSIAKKYGIRIYRIAIVSNHIHIILRAKRRWLYRSYICSITGQIAQHVMKNQSFADFFEKVRGEGVTKIQEQHKEQRFWLLRPFTRILLWGRDYKTCMNYLRQNILEALGFAAYKERKDFYAKWRTKISPV
ncbi:MAG: hypothetical protein A4S09_07400 [Proteobacteria bacterium SG_bin7]|nr:MAG: hypothetical protein A4S09_07400 [Proteobacteria bacterium SG_bin7]